MVDSDTSKVIIREMIKDDLKNGFLECLNSLTSTDISADRAEQILNEISKNSNHRIIVAIHNKKIIGSATLLIEPKFIHDGGHVGHIEDVVVDEKFQNQKIGTKIVKDLLQYSKNFGCYKTILNCSDHLVPWYTKIGGKQYENHIRHDHK